MGGGGGRERAAEFLSRCLSGPIRYIMVNLMC